MAIALNEPCPNKSVGAVIFQPIKAAVVTSTDSTAVFAGVENWTQATILLDVTAAAGTSPTLDLKLQKLLPDGATYQDIAAFTQMTGTGKRAMSIISGGNDEAAVTDGTLAAGTFIEAAFGSKWRLKAVVGGTSPSFTFSVYMEGLI